MKPARQACLGSSRTLHGSAAASSCRRPIPRRCRCSAEAPRDDEAEQKPTSTTSSSSSPPPDPEKRWRLARLWGGHSSSYRVPGVSDWLARAPQVRVRQKRDRQLEQLADLAVVNERLAGGSGPHARARVDFLRGRRRLWARVYDVVTRSDVGATLDAIERATGEVRGALELRRGGERGGDGGGPASSQQEQQTERERLGVAALRERLVSLQEQLAAATERLSTSRAKLSHNEERLRSLKAAQEALEAALARKEAEEEEEAGATAAAAAAATAAAAVETSSPSHLLDRGSWVPLAFVAELDRRPGTMLPVEVAGEPWVLFRTAPRATATAAASSDSDGNSDGDNGYELSDTVILGDEDLARTSSSPIACLRDECAHRACPLSLGSVDAAGRAVCPYHGWAYEGVSGNCVEMPSTLHRRGVGVRAMRVGVRDGVVWGWKRSLSEEAEERLRKGVGSATAAAAPSPPLSARLLLPPLPTTAATPEGFVVVAEAAVANSPSPPERVRDELARGRAALATARAPGSAAARGLLPSFFASSASSSSSIAPVDTIVLDGEGGASAVVTLASGFGGSGRSGESEGRSDSSDSPSPPLLRLLHVVAPGRDGGSRLLLRVCVAEASSAAAVSFGSGKRRLWASLAKEAAEEDARLRGGGGEGEEDGGEVAADAAATGSSVFRL